MGLGVCKIALFVALGFGYTLPDFGLFSPLPENGQNLDSLSGAQKDKANNIWAHIKQAKQLPAFIPEGSAQDKMLAHNGNEALDKVQSQNIEEQAMAEADPQGSDAVRAALAYTNKSSSKNTVNNSEPQQQTPIQTQQVVTAVYNAPKAQIPVAEDTSWWGNIFAMDSLPIPRLGVDQVAYAATLDTPPPPAPVNNTSPFTPPEQLNPIRPAGTAGPQMGGIPTYNPLAPNTNPPAPNVQAYVPPESASQKEQELARREQEILSLKQQMEQRLQELQNAERKVQGMLNEAKNVENQKMQNLTNMYVNMKPRQAGMALEKLDQGIAAKILVGMKSKQAGEIMSYMNPEVTAKLTELLTRMRLGQ